MSRRLGSDTALQIAQDRHLANDIRTDLDAIGTDGPPWYPFIDSYMNAISEPRPTYSFTPVTRPAAPDCKTIIGNVIAGFGGDAAMGQRMVDGTITERDVLDAIVD